MENLERVILGDPNSKSWEFVNSVYKEICHLEDQDHDGLHFTLGKVNIINFPDGEFEPRIQENSRRRHVIFIQDSSKEPNRWLTEIMFINDALRRGSVKEITNVFPYMRWSRSEKKDKPRMPIETKVVADVLNMAYIGSRADRIITIDLHAPAVQGFFNRPVDVLSSLKYSSEQIKIICPEIINNLAIAGPDLGSTKRVEEAAEYFGANIALINKKRLDGATVKASAVIGDVKDKDVLVIDDILASGGTLRVGAEAFLDAGAKDLYAYFTHYIGVGNYQKNLERYKRIFTTDTFYHSPEERGRIEVISMAPLVALAIYRAERGKSISELFLKKK